jgi:peptidoglycan/LPS O-acetylase OafA/YrhL
MNLRVSQRLDGTRTNNFDFIRFVAAFFVIHGHCQFLAGLPTASIIGVPIHSLGVIIFFSLSGYLITDSWESQPSVSAFLAKRSLRIFPALAVVVALSAFLLGPVMTSMSLAEYFQNEATWRYLRCAALYIGYLLPGVFDHSANPIAVNGSLWSLPAEFFCYLLVAAIGLAAGRFGRVCFVMMAGIAAAIYLYHPQVVIYATDLFQWAEVAVYFFVGAAYRSFRIPLRADVALAAACVLLVAPGRIQPGALNALLWFGVPYIVLALGSEATPILRRWGRFGDVSYGMYLYSFPITQTLIALNHNSINVYILVASVSAISVACAFLSWHLVEERALRLKPSIGRVITPTRPSDAPHKAVNISI